MQQMRTATWPTKDGGSETFEMVDGVARDILEGKEAMKNDMNMGGAKVTNLRNAENDADSLPYGQAKEEFAPSGYGYGAPCISFYHTGDNSIAAFEAHLDEIIAGMADEEAKQICFTCTGIASTTFYGTLYKHRNNYAVVTGKTYYQNSSVVKCKFNGTWEAHAWDNPPMELGVEYRTTERHNGKAVYAKYYNAGTLTNNTLYSLPSGAKDLVRMEAYTSRGHLLPVGQFIKDDTSSGYFAYAVTNAGANGVYGFTDTRSDGFGNGSYDMYLKLWYTKD